MSVGEAGGPRPTIDPSFTNNGKMVGFHQNSHIIYIVSKEGKIKVIPETDKKTAEVKSCALADVAKSMEAYLKSLQPRDPAYWKDSFVQGLQRNVGFLNAKITKHNQNIDQSFWASLWEKTLGRVFGSNKIQAIPLNNYVNINELPKIKHAELSDLRRRAEEFLGKLDNPSAVVSKSVQEIIRLTRKMHEIDPGYKNVQGYPYLCRLLCVLKPEQPDFFTVVAELNKSDVAPNDRRSLRQLITDEEMDRMREYLNDNMDAILKQAKGSPEKLQQLLEVWGELSPQSVDSNNPAYTNWDEQRLNIIQAARSQNDPYRSLD